MSDQQVFQNPSELFYIVVTANPGRIKTLFIRECFGGGGSGGGGKFGRLSESCARAYVNFISLVIHSPRLVPIDGRKLESRREMVKGLKKVVVTTIC